MAAGCEWQRPDRLVERDAQAVRLPDAIGSCGDVRPPGSTAGCGKPHVRWCGRVTGRNPRHSTRSTIVLSTYLVGKQAWRCFGGIIRREVGVFHPCIAMPNPQGLSPFPEKKKCLGRARIPISEAEII